MLQPKTSPSLSENRSQEFWRQFPSHGIFTSAEAVVQGSVHVQCSEFSQALGASLQTFASPKIMSQTEEKRSVTMQRLEKDKFNHLLLSLDYFVCQHPSALCDLIESVALRTLVGWRAHRWDWGTTRHDWARLMRCWPEC